MLKFSHLYTTTGKYIALTIWTFVSKVLSLLFNTLSRFVIVFLPRSKRLLISWLQLLSAGAQENKICHCFQFFHFYLLWSDGTRGHDFSFFGCWVWSQLFSLSSITLIKRLFTSSLSAIRVVSSAYLKLLIFFLAVLIPVCDLSSLAFSMMFSSVQFSCSVVSDSLRPHGLQPTRLLRPWDFPGQSTGVGCHCLLWYTHYYI